MFKKLQPPGRKGKLDTLWETGMLVGHRSVTGEHIAIGKECAPRSRTVRRRPLEERWSEEDIENFRHAPWRVKDPAKETRAMAQKHEPKIDVKVDRSIEMPEIFMKDEERSPRMVYITRAMLDMNGYTDG